MMPSPEYEDDVGDEMMVRGKSSAAQANEDNDHEDDVSLSSRAV